MNWSYDANNNLTQYGLSVGGQQFLTTYGYDGNDRLGSIAYPMNGSVLSLAPDSLGRPTRVGNYVTTVSYFPTGLLKSMTYANGVTTNNVPDGRQRPYTVSVGKGGGSAYVGLTMLYDYANDVSSITDSANPGNNRSFGYDGIDRMTRVSSGGSDYPIVYDGAGNIRQQNFGGTLDYAYDGTTNRLLSTSGARAASYGYDARGNITTAGTTAFQYDDNARLRCALCGTANQIIYDYDAIGMRLSRNKSGQTVYQAYAPNGDLLLEFNPVTNSRQEHIYLNGQKVATSSQSAFFATAVTLASSASVVNAGQAVTLTATVTGGRTPGGVVNFYDNGSFLGSATISAGTATFTSAALPFGYHSFSASYAGDGSNAVSSTTVSSRVESGQVTAIMSIINSVLLSD